MSNPVVAPKLQKTSPVEQKTITKDQIRFLKEEKKLSDEQINQLIKDNKYKVVD